MERPTGITTLAVLNFIGAALTALGAVVFMVGFGMMGAAGKAAEPSGGASSLMLLGGLGAVGAVIFLFCAAFGVAIGYGLWTLRNWARVIQIICIGLGLLGCLLGVLTSLVGFHIVNLVLNAGFGALYVWILWYLFQPHVKQAFGVS